MQASSARTSMPQAALAHPPLGGSRQGARRAPTIPHRELILAVLPCARPATQPARAHRDARDEEWDECGWAWQPRSRDARSSDVRPRRRVGSDSSEAESP